MLRAVVTMMLCDTWLILRLSTRGLRTRNVPLIRNVIVLKIGFLAGLPNVLGAKAQQSLSVDILVYSWYIEGEKLQTSCFTALVTGVPEGGFRLIKGAVRSPPTRPVTATARGASWPLCFRRISQRSYSCSIASPVARFRGAGHTMKLACCVQCCTVCPSPRHGWEAAAAATRGVQ